MIDKIISMVQQAAMSTNGNVVEVNLHRLKSVLENEPVMANKKVKAAIKEALKDEQDALLAAELEKKRAEKAAADKDLQKAAADQAAKQAAFNKAQDELEKAKKTAIKAAKEAIDE